MSKSRFEWRGWSNPRSTRPSVQDPVDDVDRAGYISPGKRIENLMQAGDALAIARMRENLYDLAADSNLSPDEVGISDLNIYNADLRDAEIRIKRGNEALQRIHAAAAKKKEEEAAQNASQASQEPPTDQQTAPPAPQVPVT